MPPFRGEGGELVKLELDGAQPTPRCPARDNRNSYVNPSLAKRSIRSFSVHGVLPDGLICKLCFFGEELQVFYLIFTMLYGKTILPFKQIP